MEKFNLLYFLPVMLVFVILIVTSAIIGDRIAHLETLVRELTWEVKWKTTLIYNSKYIPTRDILWTYLNMKGYTIKGDEISIVKGKDDESCF
jgi:hypothetical protein